MKLALLGSKQKVKGFDIQAHSKFVQGSMYVEKQKDMSKEENDHDLQEVEDEVAEIVET